MVKKLNKKAKKVLNKLLDIAECPYCKEDLLENGIGWIETGSQFCTVSLDKSSLSYDEDEFQGDGEGTFSCRGCGEELDYSEDKVIEILEMEKHEKKN